MNDESARKPSSKKKLIIVGILALAAAFTLFRCGFRDDGDTPIIVRDGSIVIASKGADINLFSRLGDNLLIHPARGKALGRVKVNGTQQTSHCPTTQLCAYEFVWTSGSKEGQPGYQVYRVYLWSGSPQSKGANIYSSVPISSYTYARQDPADSSLSTLTWVPADKSMTFSHASVITVPAGTNRPNPPSRLCNTANCRVEFEYR